MVLFVIVVVLSVVVATTVATGARRGRAAGLLAFVGLALWAVTATVLALMGGVHPFVLAVVGISLGHLTHDVTRRRLTAPGRPLREFAASYVNPNAPDAVHWSVLAAAGTSAGALEGYWAYRHLLDHGGALGDLTGLAAFTVLATLTVAGTCVGCLAMHTRAAHRPDPVPPTPAPRPQPRWTGNTTVRLPVLRPDLVAARRSSLHSAPGSRRPRASRRPVAPLARPTIRS